MIQEHQQSIHCGDRVVLINWRNVQNGIYSEIDTMLFEQLGTSLIKVRFEKRKMNKCSEDVSDPNLSVDIDVASEDLEKSVFGVSYDGDDDSTYAVVLDEDPERGTTLAAMGLKRNCRVVAYDGVSCLNEPAPGILLHLENVKNGTVPSTKLRFTSKIPIIMVDEIDDIPIDEDAGQIEFMVLNGSVGLSLKETEDRSGCEINTIQDNSQGFDLGFQIYDQFLHINNKLIPKDETAFDVVMSYLQNEPRPARIVMYRPPEAPEEEEEEEDVEEEPEEIIADDSDIPLKKEKSEEGAFDLGMFGGDDSDDTESDNDGEVDTKKQKFSNSKITQAKKAAKNIKTKQAAAKAKKAEKKKQKEEKKEKEKKVKEEKEKKEKEDKEKKEKEEKEKKEKEEKEKKEKKEKQDATKKEKEGKKEEKSGLFDNSSDEEEEEGKTKKEGETKNDFPEFVRPTNKKDITKDEFAITHSATTSNAIWKLPNKPSAMAYNVRWKESKLYKKKPVVFGKTVIGKYGWSNTEVQDHGDKSNLKKGIIQLDRLIGIQNTLIQDETYEETMALLTSALKAVSDTKPFILRFEHHINKFEKLKKIDKKNKETEFDIKFKKHPLDMGIELTNFNGKPVILQIEDRSFADKQVELMPGMVVIGIEGHSLANAPYTTVDHMIHYVENPSVIRFEKLKYKMLPKDKDVPDGHRDLELSKEDYKNKKLSFDTHTAGYDDNVGKLLVSKSDLSEFKKDEILIGIDGINTEDMLHSQVLYMLKLKSENIGEFGSKSDKKMETITLRMKLRESGISLEENEDALESERSELSNAQGFNDLFGPKKSKISVNMMLKLKKKFKKGKLGPIKEGQYEISLSNTSGLELCGGPSENEEKKEVKGSVVYHKDKMVDKKARKKLNVGDRVVGVDGMNMYDAEHHEVDYCVFEKIQRGKKILRMETVVLQDLKEKASDEVDCKLSYDAVINIPWTGKTDFDACIKDNLADGHPAKAAGLGKGDRLIGIGGKDVRVLPFNGVLKHLKSKLKEKKGDIQFRFKNLPDEYWDEFYKKKAEQASFDDDDLFA